MESELVEVEWISSRISRNNGIDVCLDTVVDAGLEP